jgi:general transcription factor 3C polypeptide 3 (transcription factor C subunit 4)
MHEYRRVRSKAGVLPQEQQEMEFNFARVWHSLGLMHLAVEGYQRVLTLGRQILAQANGKRREGNFVEDFSSEAALALQTIYALGGDLIAAKKVTEEWLVI